MVPDKGTNPKTHISVSNINIRESISILLFRIICLDLVTAAFIIIFFNLACSDYLNMFIAQQFISYHSLFFIILAGLKIYLTIFIILTWLNEYYEITPREVIHKRGLIWRKVERYEFDYVRYVNLDQGIFGRMFNFGTISLVDIRKNIFMHMYQIHNPHKYIHIIKDLVHSPHEEQSIVKPHFFGEDKEDYENEEKPVDQLHDK